MNGSKKKLILAAAALAACAGVPALAQYTAPAEPAAQQRWYVDLGGGQGKARGDGVASGRKSVWAARFGMRLNPNVAIDLDYDDLGKYPLVPTGTAKAKSWGGSLELIAPMEAFDIYGRLGYARTTVSVDVKVTGTGLTAKAHENEAFYGVGGRYNFGGAGVFVEWNRHDKSEIDYWLVGVQLRF